MRTIILTLSLLFTAQLSMAQLPDPGFEIDEHTAIVLTDPQNDFLSEDGVAWGLVGPSVEKNNTIQNIDTLFQLAEKFNLPVFISPHYVYDHDHKWDSKGSMIEFAHSVGLFDAGDAKNGKGASKGIDIYKAYEKYLSKDNVTIVSPHKIFGPESNDLVLQLRKRKINKVILGGMLSNLCTEAHLRELMEQGFEVGVVKDATAAAILPEMDGYETALVNFALIANHVFTTSEIKKAIEDYFAKK